jgi:hypothetical protein
MAPFFESFENNISITPQGERSIINEKNDDDIIGVINLNNSLHDEDGNDRDSQTFLSDRMYRDLIEDPDNLFKKFCFEDDLQVHFQAIALAKLSGKSLTEIAAEFNLNLDDLISFFQDCCCYYADWFESKYSSRTA